jgi:hypothetical protein
VDHRFCSVGMTMNMLHLVHIAETGVSEFRACHNSLARTCSGFLHRELFPKVLRRTPKAIGRRLRARIIMHDRADLPNRVGLELLYP